MKRLSHVKTLKRLNIISQPAQVADITADTYTEEYTDAWLLEAEKVETKRLRRFRRQLAS